MKRGEAPDWAARTNNRVEHSAELGVSARDRQAALDAAGSTQPGRAVRGNDCLAFALDETRQSGESVTWTQAEVAPGASGRGNTPGDEDGRRH